MPNPYYSASGAPSQGSSGSSAVMRAEFLALVTAFDKMPTLAGNGGKLLRVNAGATGLEAYTHDFLTTTAAAATYATIASLSSYLTSATAAATYVELAGDTMTGPLTLPRYVNNAASAAGAFNDYSIAGVIYGYIGGRTGVLGSGSGFALRSEGAFYLGTGGANERLQVSTGGEFGLNCTAVGTAPLRVQVAGSNDAGLEMFRDSATRWRMQAYNRNAGSYVDFVHSALTHRWELSGVLNSVLDGTGLGVGNAPAHRGTFYTGGAVASYVQVANGSTGVAAGNGTLFGVDSSGNGVINTQGAFSTIFATNGSNRWSILSTGHINPATDNALDVGAAALRIRTVFTPFVSDGATATRTMLSASGNTARIAAGSDWTGIEFYIGGVLAGQVTPKLDWRAGAFTATNSQAFSATPTFNANLSNIFELGALTANVTSCTITNPSNGQTISIRVIQDGTGSRTFAAPAGSKIVGAIGATAGAASILTLTYSAASTRWEGSWLALPV